MWLAILIFWHWLWMHSLVDILRGSEVAIASHPQSLRWLWKLPCHEWRNVDYCCCWWRYCSSRRFRHFSRARLRRRRARLATCRPLCRSALSQRQPVDSCRPWIPEPTGCFRFEPDILEKYIDIINSFINVVYGINNTKHGESGKGLVWYRNDCFLRNREICCPWEIQIRMTNQWEWLDFFLTKIVERIHNKTKTRWKSLRFCFRSWVKIIQKFKLASSLFSLKRKRKNRLLSNEM